MCLSRDGREAGPGGVRVPVGDKGLEFRARLLKRELASQRQMGLTLPGWGSTLPEGALTRLGRVYLTGPKKKKNFKPCTNQKL